MILHDRIVLVCGGRDFKDRQAVWLALDRLRETRGLGTLVHGACHLGGADLLADQWAKAAGVVVVPYRVRHDLDGPWPGAGPRRNARMLADARPSLVVAFPGGSGTEGMVSLAEEAGVPVWRPYPSAQQLRDVLAKGGGR
jgi:hypothetical protein